MSRTIITILGVLSLMVCPAVVSAGYVSVTDLGIPGTHLSSAAYDFTSDGKVAVQGTTSSTVLGAYVWQNGSYTDCGTLGGTYAYPRGIDEDGTVVGMSRTSTSTTSGRAYKWTPTGGMVNLGTLGGSQSRADFINDGDIVGSSQPTGSSAWHAFVIYSGTTTMVDIHSLNTNSYAYKINDAGHVVGYCTGTSNHGFFYNGTTMQTIGMLTGHTASIAYGMNNSDVVVGYSSKSGEQQAVYWTPAGGMVGLGFLDNTQLYSNGREINNLGQIVGDAKINVGTEEAPVVQTHAVIWNNGVIKDLNDYVDPASGWLLQQGTMIDDNGTIVGYGLKDGVAHGFIMTIPEPSTFALLAAGLLGLMAYAWRKRK